MEGRVSVADAWSLEPLGRLTVGTKEYDVPPLTLARFQRLLSLDTAKLTDALAGGDERAAAPFAAVLVPGLDLEDWRFHCDVGMVATLYTLFYEGHDWRLIGEAIGFGEQRAPGETFPTQAEVTAGLVAVARRTGYRVEDLLAMRVEGFYLLVDALRVENDRVAEPTPIQMTDPVDVGEGGRASDALLDAMLNATTE